MTTAGLLVGVLSLSGMAVAIGLLFAWRVKNDPATTSAATGADSDACLHRALYWLASTCLCIGVGTVGYLVYRFDMGAA